MLFVVATGAVLLVTGTAAWYWGQPLQAQPTAPAEGFVVEASEPTVAVEHLTVYVTGEVVSPGLVSVPVGSRVADAIAAAGGGTAGAVLSGLNLATPVTDGLQIVVPSEGGDPPAEPAAGSAADGRVAVNRATAEELERLPGVGPVLAARIIEHREAYGPFTQTEDLLDVPGIGEGKLATMRDAVIIP